MKCGTPREDRVSKLDQCVLLCNKVNQGVHLVLVQHVIDVLHCLGTDVVLAAAEN